MASRLGSSDADPLGTCTVNNASPKTLVLICAFFELALWIEASLGTKNAATAWVQETDGSLKEKAEYVQSSFTECNHKCAVLIKKLLDTRQLQLGPCDVEPASAVQDSFSDNLALAAGPDAVHSAYTAIVQTMVQEHYKEGGEGLKKVIADLKIKAFIKDVENQQKDDTLKTEHVDKIVATKKMPRSKALRTPVLDWLECDTLFEGFDVPRVSPPNLKEYEMAAKILNSFEFITIYVKGSGAGNYERVKKFAQD